MQLCKRKSTTRSPGVTRAAGEGDFNRWKPTRINLFTQSPSDVTLPTPIVKKVGASLAAARAQSRSEFYPNVRLVPNSIHYSLSDTSGGGGREARVRNKERENPIKERKGQRWEQKVARYIYTGRAMQREDEKDGDIGNPRRERENERGIPSGLSTVVRAGWKLRRGGRRTLLVVLVMLG